MAPVLGNEPIDLFTVTSGDEVLFVGGLMVVMLSFLILLVLFSSRSGRKMRKWEDEPPQKTEVPVRTLPKKEEKKLDDEIVEKLESLEPTTEFAPEEENTLKWIKKRRSYINTKLSKLERKMFTIGLTKEEEIKRKLYEQELFVIQQELLKNEAFIKELNNAVDWAIKEAKKGVPSKKIREKLLDQGYSKKEMEIIKRVFNQRKDKT